MLYVIFNFMQVQDPGNFEFDIEPIDCEHSMDLRETVEMLNSLLRMSTSATCATLR